MLLTNYDLLRYTKLLTLWATLSKQYRGLNNYSGALGYIVLFTILVPRNPEEYCMYAFRPQPWQLQANVNLQAFCWFWTWGEAERRLQLSSRPDNEVA